MCAIINNMNIISPFPKKVYERNAELYKALAHPVRLEILNILKLQETSLEDLSEHLQIAKSNTSQHLAILRRLRVVRVRREGQRAMYQLTDSNVVETCRVLRDLWSDEEARL